MRRSITTALMGLGLATIAVPASAAVTLVMGDNTLTTQIHADATMPDTGNTVYGVTFPGSTQISFLGTSILHITGGSGYAQINDGSALDSQVLDDMEIFITSGGGFTGYEFTIQFAAAVVGQATPAYLTIGYELEGGGTGSFSFVDGDPVLDNLEFKNSAATDFRLAATGGDVITRLFLTSSLPFDQIKQNDIELAAAPVPEPATWAMMLIGFAGAGVALRRKRRNALLQLA